MKAYYVYILSNRTDTVLYIGITNDLIRRVYEHKEHLVEGFTKKYRVGKLVYYEHTSNAFSAIAREKQLKSWRREKKVFLIEAMNQEWEDLYPGLVKSTV